MVMSLLRFIKLIEWQQFSNRLEDTISWKKWWPNSISLSWLTRESTTFSLRT